MGHSRGLTENVNSKADIRSKVTKTWVKEFLFLLFIGTGNFLVCKFSNFDINDTLASWLFAASLFVICRSFTQFERTQLKYISDTEQRNILSNEDVMCNAEVFCKKLSKMQRNLTVGEASLLYKMSDKIIK